MVRKPKLEFPRPMYAPRTHTALPHAPTGAAAPPNWTQDDEVFRAEWLDGKTHPLTGEPLEIVELELPKGSIVSCLSHCPHAVSPKDEGLETRLCTLFCYGASVAVAAAAESRMADMHCRWPRPTCRKAGPGASAPT